MGIVFAEELVFVRERVRETLESVSRNNQLRILDCGGGINSWLGDLVTDVIDIEPRLSRAGVTVHHGDICSPVTWEPFKDDQFDFVNCTHTLEDIRDPMLVIQQMQRVARAGFVAVPSRHIEFTSIESSSYLGFGHHRWVFHVRQAQLLEASAKWPGVASRRRTSMIRSSLRGFMFSARDFLGFSLRAEREVSQGREKITTSPEPTSANRGLVSRARISSFRLIRRQGNAILHSCPPAPRLSWRLPVEDDRLELSLVWVGSLPFRYFRNDYAGSSIDEMVAQTEQFLSSSFQPASDVDDALKVLVDVLEGSR